MEGELKMLIGKHSLFDVCAMMDIEKSRPDDVTRLDELHAKEKRGTISKKEAQELKILDSLLLKEFERIRLHYMLNFPFMDRQQKRELIERAKEWLKKFKEAETQGVSQGGHLGQLDIRSLQRKRLSATINPKKSQLYSFTGYLRLLLW